MAWTEATQANYRRPDDHRQNDVSDSEWALIAPLIPAQGRMGRPRTADLRRVFNAIQFMLGTGCQWRSIPPRFPPFTTVQHYVDRDAAFRADAREAVCAARVDTLESADCRRLLPSRHH